MAKVIFASALSAACVAGWCGYERVALWALTANLLVALASGALVAIGRELRK